MKRRKVITKEELEKLYRDNTNAQVCKVLKISNATLNSYLKQYGIPFKGRGRMKKLKVIV